MVDFIGKNKQFSRKISQIYRTTAKKKHWKIIDATKSNFFFCRGLMIVEGDAENLLMPSLSKLLGYDFTESGVSIVNVGHTGLSRYANLFSGTELHPNPGIKVACLHDLDLIPFNAARELKLDSIKTKSNLECLWDKAAQNINDGVASRRG